MCASEGVFQSLAHFDDVITSSVQQQVRTQMRDFLVEMSDLCGI